MSKSEEYWRGHRDGQEAAKQWLGSYVVVFDDDASIEERKDVANLLERGVRGVAKVLPVGESHYNLKQWCELAEALGVTDTSDDHAHECALRNAQGAAASLRDANALYEAFFAVATPEQQRAAVVALDAARKANADVKKSADDA